MLVDNGPNGLVTNTILSTGYKPDPRAALCITLCKVGPATYARERTSNALRGQPSTGDIAGPEDDIYILDESEVRFDLARFFVECGRGLMQLCLTPFHVAGPRVSWDSARSCFISRPDEEFWGYVKIYPDANIHLPRVDNFGFFVLAYRRRPGVFWAFGKQEDPYIFVVLVPQAVWKQYEHIRQDGIWLIKLAAHDINSVRVELGSNKILQIGQYRVLAKLDFARDPETWNENKREMTIKLSLAG
ncbi:hypothetical protein MN608_11310 [Microdochium nivale]|nr:hypothetical protein MN608_11310 [Microdochium nivale]